ncbi:DUF1778 domain-containing protein [Mesorhizobium sp. VK9D]|uniref:type II toxin -antitoxin system TacA 1-like antitoxin n=1 Tax=Mesorhizobium australafricanum TaxID=3072311 RepID=UPI002A242B5E|nr:DUF1778 domain-containing protein [Mesorhizobium sp. VK9D]MDX8456604.1 DUF1778 domain-containing protein [Mesorhizobium sp. VK9D]
MPEQTTNKTDFFDKATEAIKVSERDFEQILKLLEHPPRPNDKLQAAIAALPCTL